MEVEEILRKLRERIVGFAASRIERDAAEDVAQEVLMLLHQKYGHLQRMEDLAPLSFQIVRFKLWALRRKSVRRGESGQVSIDDVQLADMAPSPEQEAERSEMRARLMEALALMGARCRDLLGMKLAGKTFAEIQRAMGAKTINTVYTWDSRCRAELLRRMGGAWERP